MPLLNSVVTTLACEHDECIKELKPGEGVFFDNLLLCYPHYEEVLEAQATSFLADQIHIDHDVPDLVALVLTFGEVFE